MNSTTFTNKYALVATIMAGLMVSITLLFLVFYLRQRQRKRKECLKLEYHRSFIQELFDEMHTKSFRMSTEYEKGLQTPLPKSPDAAYANSQLDHSSSISSSPLSIGWSPSRKEQIEAKPNFLGEPAQAHVTTSR